MVRAHLERKVGRVRHTIRDLLSEGRGWILIVVAFGWLLSLGTRLIFPALLPHIKATYSLGNATAGAIISAIGIVVATMQFPSGALADRFGERVVVVVSMFLASAGLTIIAAFPAFAAFLLGGIVFGVGMGSYGSPRVMVLSNIYPDRDGTALGITFSAGHVGTSVLPFVAGLVTVALGWRVGFLYVVPLFLLVAFGLWRFVPSHTRTTTERADRSKREVAREAFSAVTRPAVLLAFGGLALWSFTFIGITTFLPTYLVSIKSFDSQLATSVFSLLFVAGLFAQAGAGNAADRFGYRRVLVPLAGFSVLPLVLLPFTGGLVALAVLVLLIGARLGLMPVLNAYLIASVPDEVQGLSYGLIRSLQAYIGSTGAVFVGVLADAGLFDQSFLVLAGITVVMTLIYAALPVVSD